MTVLYRGGLTDSGRWRGFVLRPGDIVISTPSKCGTTWTQMICALLVFRTPLPPGRLTGVSPWLDMRLRPVEEVFRLLHGQRHRRFIKTHTPLDGLPHHPDVTYLTVARDPLDVAASMADHRANLVDLSELLLRHEEAAALAAPPGPEPSPAERISRWITDERRPGQCLESLRGLAHHLRLAWEHRDAPGTVLLHYADLTHDLDGQMRRLADHLGIPLPAHWDSLVEAASFPAMRARSAALAPDEGLGLFCDTRAFFHHGPRRPRPPLNPDTRRTYDALIADLLPPAMLPWLQRPTSRPAR